MLKKRLKKWFRAITKRNKLAVQTYKNYCYSLEAAASKKIVDLINEIYNLFYVIINDWKKVKQISPLKTWNALAFSFYYNLDAPSPLHDYDAPAISSSFCDIVYDRKKIEQLYVLKPVSFVVVDKNHKGRVVVKIDN